MCNYKEICPVYDKRSNDCNEYYQYGSARCIPFFLEAYYGEKGTPFDAIMKYFHIPDDTIGFKMITVLDVFKTCDKEYQKMILEKFCEILSGSEE